MSIASWEVEVFFRHTSTQMHGQCWIHAWWSMLHTKTQVTKYSSQVRFYMHVQPCLNVKTFSCIIDINYQLN